MHDRAMMMDLRSGQTRALVAQEPLMSSARAGWNGFLVERHRLGAFEKDHVCSLQHVVFLQLDNTASLEWRGNGTSRLRDVSPGQICVLPAYLPYSARCPNTGEFIAVSLENKFVACAAAEIGALDRVELEARHGEEDPLVREVLLSLQAEAEQGQAGGAVYAESLATTLAVHLLRKYSVSAPLLRVQSPGLGKQQLRRTVEYIHDHLSGNISLLQLASVAGLSPFHFARQFKRTTGVAPHEYVIRCRVERAKELLLRSFANIADVAFQVGFYDQSHLTRHFKRFYNLTPAAFARRADSRKILH